VGAASPLPPVGRLGLQRLEVGREVCHATVKSGRLRVGVKRGVHLGDMRGLAGGVFCRKSDEKVLALFVFGV